MTMPGSKWLDIHVCPMTTGPVPHVGGPVVGPVPPMPPVLACMMPPSRTGDMAVCAGPPDFLLKASTTVVVAKKPWVRIVMDPTSHGGMITGPGATTVIVGG